MKIIEIIAEIITAGYILLNTVVCFIIIPKYAHIITNP